jgi:hypothetical protein
MRKCHSVVDKRTVLKLGEHTVGPNPTGDTFKSRTTYVICDMTNGLAGYI